MATFTRSAVLLKWSGGTVERAFYIKKEGYGGHKTKPAKYGRNLSGRLNKTYGASFNRVIGIFLVRDAPTATIDGVDEGDITELEAAHDATDLQVKSFEDAAYWTAEWMGDWPPILDYDPIRSLASVPAMIEQKLDS